MKKPQEWNDYPIYYPKGHDVLYISINLLYVFKVHGELCSPLDIV